MSGIPFEVVVIWIGAICTLALYSVLYKENPVYRLFEHIFLGLAIGYGLYVTWRDVIFAQWWRPLFRDHYWMWIFALVLGLMYLAIYNKRLSWMSRLVMTLMMGLAAGLAFRKFFGQYVPQIGASFKPLAVTVNGPDGLFDPGRSVFASFTNVLFVVCLLTVMTYFFFSFEQRGRAVTSTARLGRWIMMIAFGAMFGSTVMARMSLFIGRLDFLFREWLHMIK